MGRPGRDAVGDRRRLNARGVPAIREDLGRRDGGRDRRQSAHIAANASRTRRRPPTGRRSSTRSWRRATRSSADPARRKRRTSRRYLLMPAVSPSAACARGRCVQAAHSAARRRSALRLRPTTKGGCGVRSRRSRRTARRRGRIAGVEKPIRPQSRWAVTDVSARPTDRRVSSMSSPTRWAGGARRCASTVDERDG